MKKARLNSILILMTVWGALSSTGCRSHRAVVIHERADVIASPGRVVVSHRPPPMRTEVVTVAPTAEHVWIAGHWMYINEHWQWYPGHWELRPRAGAGYFPGHWDKTPAGWVYTPGHWD